MVEELSQLRKVEKMQLPRRHKDTNPDSYRDHKEFIFNDLFLVQLCALVPLWQKKNTFRSGLKS